MEQAETVLPEILEVALSENDEKLLVDCLQQSGEAQVRWCLVARPTLFIRMCAGGFTVAVEHAINASAAYINHSTELEGRTALQWACLLGHLEIVRLLLVHVKPIQDAWRETSEFYSASLGGHLDVVHELIRHSAELVTETDVRTALLYAACNGGSLPVVRFWLTPQIDINEPVALVSQLNNCENLVPLYAACKGKHEAVGRYLLKSLDAEITQHIAMEFPELTASLVESVYCPVSMELLDNESGDTEVKYKLRRRNVHVVHPLWLQPFLTNIIHLDLSCNKLLQLPDCVPWSMPNLIIMDVSHNRLTVLAPPADAEGVLCQSLEELLMSNNKLSDVCGEVFHMMNLTKLDLSQNSLGRLKSWPSTASADAGPKKFIWQCSSLETLHLSHNQLDLLTNDISGCKSLKKLYISHNQLCSLPSAWDCRLEHLDASHNILERFPSSTETFWSGSLATLNLQHNNLDQLGENILKLGMLEKLDVSHNNITFLASPHVWDCPSLLDLNLSHNKLGALAGKELEFPSEILTNLRQFNISYNELSTLPLSLCNLRNLVSLDISNNPLNDLPKEMGNLTECWDLRLQGLNIRKADLQEVMNKGAKDVIEHLRNQLRKVQPNRIVKVIVLGPQGKGKSTVVKSLLEGRISPATVSDKPITQTTISLKSQEKVKIEGRRDNDRPDLSLRVWELPGQPELLALHPVMWTEHSLFLLVWDMTAGVKHLDHWLCGIQAWLARASVIIVATFRDRLPGTVADAASRVEQFHKEVNHLYGHSEDRSGFYPKDDHRKMFPHLCSVLVVSLVTKKTFKQDLQELRSAIYFSELRQKGHRAGELYIGQQLPLSYTRLDKALIQMADECERVGRPPFLSQIEFDELVLSLPDSDFGTFGDITEALKMCCQLGSILHFDVWPQGLGRLYFLNPNWLAVMIATVLKPEDRDPVSKQSMETVHMDLFRRGLPGNILCAFLQLLRHFDIGTPINEQGEEKLLLPCHLPRQTPGLQLPKTQHGIRLLRFYSLPHMPDRLWSRLILGLLLSVERLSQFAVLGMRNEKPHIVYWQKGINITYNGGSVVIESTVFHSIQEEMDYSGILISVLPDSPSIDKLAIVGFVSEEVDSAIQSIFPHHGDRTELFGTYALCPVCFGNVEPGQGAVSGDFRHFAVPECAGAFLVGDLIRCHKGNYIHLEELVPEFLLIEMPKNLHLDNNQLQVTSGDKLGVGAAGSVFKGKLHGTDVAVKVFYSDNRPGDVTPSTDSGTSSYSSDGSQRSAGYPPLSVSNVVTGEVPLTTSSCSTDSQGVYGNFALAPEQSLMMRQDSIDGRNIKICQAFTELRQEIMILSQLRHPCLIALLGVSNRPSLLVALELAPLGSLRSVLRERVADRPFNKFKDRDKIFPSMMEKDITFKILYQVAVGLEYLHDCKILYRDLKPDNILVCSLDPKDTVNIKISDYGISKFAVTQMVGMVGTPGYMAPEIMEGQAYDEKVDIFSFSMVMYEVLTGHAPFESSERLHQIQNLVNNEQRRPSLKEYNIIAFFPYLEYLMQEMWAHEACERPSARNVVRAMKDVAFLLQHSQIATADDGVRERSNSRPDAAQSDSGLFCNVTCAWAVKEASFMTGRNTCWVWEFPTGLPNDRRLSIYNLASNQYHIRHKACPGQPVTCMAKVGSHVWVGIKDGSVEVFGSSCTDIPRRQAQLEDLGADPVAIVHDKHNPNKVLPDGEGLVYVGLTDGTIHLYHHYRWFRGVFTCEWKLWKKLTVSASSLSAMCLVPAHHELWVACGHSLVIISTNSDSLLIERRICVVKDLPPLHWDKVTSIHNVVRNEHNLWCSFDGSPLIVEYDLHADIVSGAYCIEADLEVDITEVSLSWMVEIAQCGECGGFASGCDPGGRSSHRGMLADRPSEDSLPQPPPPPRPPKFLPVIRPESEDKVSSHSQVQLDASHSFSAGDAAKPEGNYTNTSALCSSNEMQDFVAVLKPECCKTVTPSFSGSSERQDVFLSTGAGFVNPPPIPPQRNRPVSDLPAHNTQDDGSQGTLSKKKSLTLPEYHNTATPSFLESSEGQDVFSSTGADSANPPPIPPRRNRPVSELPACNTQDDGNQGTLSKKKSLTLPDLSRPNRPPPPLPPPPPSPPQRSLPSVHEGVLVQSLLAVQDTLWVGSSCGEILVVGVENHYKTNDKKCDRCRNGDEAATKRDTETSPSGHKRLEVRNSLNVESRQMCNLKSASMTKDEKFSAGSPTKERSGGILSLQQAQNLVVAVRSVSQEEQARGIAEISVWEACSADRITDIRNYWRSLEARKVQLDRQHKMKT